jgi:aspartyl-tRNA(Asn)/glutamyl-tRNA(Gln) amidotransferase subunit C
LPGDPLDAKLVKKLAEIARLELSPSELEKYSEQLKVIIEAFKELDEVDTDDVKPSFHPLEISDVLREDLVEEWDWEPLSNSAHKEGKYLRGPKIR